MSNDQILLYAIFALVYAKYYYVIGGIRQLLGVDKSARRNLNDRI